LIKAVCAEYGATMPIAFIVFKVAVLRKVNDHLLDEQGVQRL